jgi:hypothetical protein
MVQESMTRIPYEHEIHEPSPVVIPKNPIFWFGDLVCRTRPDILKAIREWRKHQRLEDFRRIYL